MSRPHEREVCARRADCAPDARRNAMQIEARGRARNARAAAGSLCTGENLVRNFAAPSGPDAIVIADNPGCRPLCRRMWRHPYPSTRRRNALHERSGSIGQWRDEKPTRLRSRPAPILTMLGARPQFINAAPITMPSDQAADRWKSS